MATILAIDDDWELIEFLCTALEPLGHELLTAGDGLAALEIVKRQIPDLVLLDVNLPGIDGYEVCARLKSIPDFATVPILFLSGKTGTDCKVRGFELGGIDYVPKPFSVVELLARIKTHLAVKESRDAISKKSHHLDRLVQQSNELLHSIYPKEIATEIGKSKSLKPKQHESVAIVIADLVGFTAYCGSHSLEEVMENVQSLDREFDRIMNFHNIEKVNFVGDSLMAAAGLFSDDGNPVYSAVHCGFDLIRAVESMPARWKIRVGIDFGPVVSGIPGTQRSLFGIYGDTVNTAARMQTAAKSGKICLSARAWTQIPELFSLDSHGMAELKGKGLMECYNLDPTAHEGRQSINSVCTN